MGDDICRKKNVHTGVIKGAELPRWNLDVAYCGHVKSQPTSAESSFGYGLVPPNGTDRYGPGFQAVLYCRGKQYMHCNREEDASLATWVRLDEDGDGEPGNWKGKLTSFYFENGVWIQIQQHVIG